MKFYQMKIRILTISCLFAAFFCVAQEFEAEVTINAEQTGQANLQVFKTLENAIEEFVNSNKWTTVEYLPQERISCSFYINLTSFSGNNFTGSLQVQASRPVFNSGYTTTVANFNDKNVTFEYLEFQPLVYNENADSGSLVNLVAYYLYTILGIDGDTFANLGGTTYYEQAKQIVNVAQTSGGPGWNAISGTQSRFKWNDDILSGIFTDYRELLYNYHIKGLDVMEKNQKDGKKAIIEALEGFKNLNRKRPNSYVMRTFFDAKAIEISRLLSGGPKMNIASTVEMLQNIAPSYKQDWETITF